MLGSILILHTTLNAASTAPNLDKLPNEIAEAIVIAEQLEVDPKTKSYHDNQLLPYFGNKYSFVLKECFSQTEAPDTSPLKFVIALNTVGNPERVYSDNQSNIFKCLLPTIFADQFPPPPIPHYLLYIDLKFTD